MGEMRNEGAVRIGSSVVRLLGSEMRFKDANQTAMKVGTADPTVTAQNMPAGSIYYDTNTKRAWIKMDAGITTNFRLLNDNEYVKDPTGFVDPDGITVTYTKASRQVSLYHTSGTVEFLIRGRKYAFAGSEATPWVVPTALGGSTPAEHTDAAGTYFLYVDSSSGNVVFSTTSWAFSDLMICSVFKNATAQFGLREVHGLMSHVVHSELHSAIGTYLKAAIGMATGTAYTATSAATATTASNCPGINAGELFDEDLKTVVAAWPQADWTIDTYVSGNYTTAYRNGGSGAITFSEVATVPYVTAGAGVGIIQRNPITAGSGALADVTATSYVNVLVMSLPVTADADSQKFRFVFFAGQQEFTTLAAAQLQNPMSWDFGEFSSAIPEYVAVQMYSYQRSNATGANVVGRAFLAALPVVFTGSRTSLTGYTGVAPSDHQTLSNRGTASGTYYHPTSGIATDTSWGGVDAADRLLTTEATTQDALVTLGKYATASIGGVLSAGAQTIGGLKTFAGGIAVSGGAAAAETIALVSGALRIGGAAAAASGSLDAGTTPVISWGNASVTIAQPLTVNANCVLGTSTASSTIQHLIHMKAGTLAGGTAGVILITNNDASGVDVNLRFGGNTTTREAYIAANKSDGTAAGLQFGAFTLVAGGFDANGAWSLGTPPAGDIPVLTGYQYIHCSNSSGLPANFGGAWGLAIGGNRLSAISGCYRSVDFFNYVRAADTASEGGFSWNGITTAGVLKNYGWVNNLGAWTFGQTNGAALNTTYGGMKFYESSTSFGGVVHGVAASSDYNGLMLASNLAATTFNGSQANAALPSWAIDVGGRDVPQYGSADTFSILRRAAGSATVARLASCSNTGAWTFPVSVATPEIVSTGGVLRLRPNTTDGSDTAYASISGGGAHLTETRGGYIVAFGNENVAKGGLWYAAGYAATDNETAHTFYGSTGGNLQIIGAKMTGAGAWTFTCYSGVALTVKGSGATNATSNTIWKNSADTILGYVDNSGAWTIGAADTRQTLNGAVAVSGFATPLSLSTGDITLDCTKYTYVYVTATGNLSLDCGTGKIAGLTSGQTVYVTVAASGGTRTITFTRAASYAQGSSVTIASGALRIFTISGTGGAYPIITYSAEAS